MAQHDFKKTVSMLQQIGVAVEQHHQIYLGQYPLVLVAKEDYDALVEYYNTQVAPDEYKFGIDNPPTIFGAKIQPTSDTLEGRVLIAKVVYCG